MYEQTFPPDLFINRELSWLEFNARVLEEAEDERTPLLERLKFLAIFSSNLDEFFMVRVAGLREQAFGDGAPQDYSPDGLRAIAQLQKITKRTQELVARQYRCWNESVRPALAREGIRLLSIDELTPDHQAALDRFFRERALPILTPMAIDPAHPSPRYHNRGLYLAAMLERRRGLGPKQLFAVVQVPQVLPRLVPLGGGEQPPIHSAGRSGFGAAAGIVRRLRRAFLDHLPHHARQRYRSAGARIGRHAAADRRPPEDPPARRSGAAGSFRRRQRGVAADDHR